MSNSHFYSNLEAVDLPLSEVLLQENLLHNVPGDWHVIVTDIKNSTLHYEQGKLKELNTVAARSLAIALGVAQKHNIAIPYIYGGDGATVLVPQEIHDETMHTLRQYASGVTKELGMELRVGSVSIKSITSNNYNVAVSRMFLARHHSPTVFADSGLYYAEREIKNNPASTVSSSYVSKESEGDISGSETVWVSLYEPAEHEVSLCLIIESTNEHSHKETYASVLKQVNEAYGEMHKTHPFSTKAAETGMLATDAIKFDGQLKMVLIGTEAQALALLEHLHLMEEAAGLIFGHTKSRDTIITAVIEHEKDIKLGLVDVAEGGYTKASIELKRKKSHEL